ncbi:F-box only protein 36b [Genypterus blacodes]|uniref:F-box only protein 36b n=1 Tax=Genypterus blacodes TaxID=154954 RepID=UPI003F76C104
MASLLSDPLFEIFGRAPSANKNLYYFAVTKSDVIWRWWKISLRKVDRCSRPGEQRDSYQDFLDDRWLQSEVSMVFGRRILQYTKALCRGQYDYLDHLPDSLLLHILSYLELQDVGHLGQTSRKFRQLCKSEELWEKAVRRCCDTVSAEVSSLALEVGWQSIFFTNKLQLQKLIRRRRLRIKEHQEGQTCDPPGEGSETDQPSTAEVNSQNSSQLRCGTDTGFDTAGIDPVLIPGPELGSDSSNT